ncbi:hypothetical protein BH10ACT9_BH10ACT9_02110 [soil metagenome]
MSGKHHQNTGHHMQSTSGSVMPHRNVKRSRAATILTSTSIALAFAGFTTAVIVAGTDNGAAPQPQTAQTSPAAAEIQTPRPVQQQGVVVAVTADSITARSADGFVQTYLVTPNTTAVTQEGGDSFGAATPFAVNDRVAIHATVISGTATATAVADTAVIGPDGPPMDSV